MKKFRFRLQVVLDLREKELEQKQMEMAKILAVLNEQKRKLESIHLAKIRNNKEMDVLNTAEEMDIRDIESHRLYGIKLAADIRNQERVIENTQSILEKKQQEVQEAHRRAEVLKKLKENQEKEYYKEFFQAEAKELDDITSARYGIG